MANTIATADVYKRVDVETASQGKLITMLFNGAIQRAEEAKRHMAGGRVQSIHDNLIRAQDIVTELRSALDMTAGEVATNLDRIYEYILHLLMRANIDKDVEKIDEAVEHMTAMRDTWIEVFAKAAEERPEPKPQLDPHGASALNLKG